MLYKQSKEYLLEKLKAAGLKSKPYTTQKGLEKSQESHIGAVLFESETLLRNGSKTRYDRYVKTTAQGATKALKVFLFDNVVEESRASLEANLEEFPALALSIGEKLLGMLGLSKQTNLKML